jgi:hypothetical protein
MCDTIGVLLDSSAIFGKNSDRSPNEPQAAEFYPARVCKESDLAATYITIPQARETLAVLLSRPTWMWGAEIGVNEAGVAIGNEAVFTKGAYGKPALTGMDLLRLARSAHPARRRRWTSSSRCSKHMVRAATAATTISFSTTTRSLLWMHLSSSSSKPIRRTGS